MLKTILLISCIAVILASVISKLVLTQLVDFEDIELMQYTGLKDKNGVEIYEGEIIKAKGYPAIEVIYNKDDCSFRMKVQYIGWFDLLILSHNKTPHLEVIGNIYENKELLNE